MTAKRILVVDDEPDAAESFCEFFMLLGMDCRIALTGQDAVAIARDWAPQLMLLDINLPDISGFEVARRVKALSEPAPWIAAISGQDPPRSTRDIDEFIMKPPTFERLAELVRI